MNNLSSHNYSAWNIKVEDFLPQFTNRERLAFLVNFAVLAPSSHNSQPWQFEVTDKKIILREETARALTKSDTHKRQQFISMGAALENLLVAGDYYGYRTAVAYTKNEAQQSVIEVAFEKIGEPKKDLGHLIYIILKRRTNRANYDTKKTVGDEIILDIQNSTQFFSDVYLDIIHDDEKKSLITEAILTATNEAMSDAEFRRELAKYIVPSKTNSSLGMPGNTIEVPFLFSYLLPSLLKMTPPPASQSTQLRSQLLEHTPFFLVLSSQNDTEEDWLKIGRTFEQIALKAEKHGLAVHPLAAIVEIGNHRETLANVIGNNTLPQFFFRLGYPTKKVPHSPRLKNDEVTISQTSGITSVSTRK